MLSSTQKSICRLMIAANPDPAYMESLAAMDDATAGSAITAFCAGRIPEIQSQAADIDRQIARLQAVQSDMADQLTLMQSNS